MEQRFIVDLEAARARENANALLDPPSFRQENKALRPLWSKNHLDRTFQSGLNGIDEPFLVPAIDDNGLHPGIKAHQTLDQGEASS